MQRTKKVGRWKERNKKEKMERRILKKYMERKR